MPELPEVETTRRGLVPHLVHRRVTRLSVRQASLRWPVSSVLRKTLPGQRIVDIERRGKYLLVHTQAGSALLHLGMSGSLRVLPEATPALRHDAIDWHLDSGFLLRFTDPRRFGCQLWQASGETHALLANLGVEPLSNFFHGEYLKTKASRRRVPVKNFIMNQTVVVGVGNIYAAEALFLAGIHPESSAGNLSKARYQRLALAIQDRLRRAIERGGTTLRDFTNPEGAPGYFEQELYVYGREGQPCRHCRTLIQRMCLGQRGTYFCPRCQS